MTEFKPGDRIRAVRDTTSEYGVRIPKGSTGTVYDSRYAALAFRPDDDRTLGEFRFIRPDDFERDHGTGDGSASDICAEPGCNCDLERRFPAPLDPSKVKAGDTVTLEKGTAKHVDLVADVDRYQDGDYRFKSTTSPTHVYRVGDGAWTLTAHQPAPEPEPEWKPGTVLLGNLPGLDPDDPFWVVDDGETDPYVVDDTGVKHYPADLLNVRKALVIDPADVDVEALTKIADEAYLTDRSELRADGIQAAIRAVLEHLGLNR
jgi:hypothetical protein